VLVSTATGNLAKKTKARRKELRKKTKTIFTTLNLPMASQRGALGKYMATKQ
jgi:hypothetical protein